ncbi:MAG TPA: hypothetical protein VF184_05645 [Phycisphaeraceae bacterium]
MNLSRRERMIGLAALIAVALLAADRLLLSPLLEKREAMAMERAALTEELDRALLLMRSRREAMSQWRRMTDEALIQDQAAAESRLLHALRTWSRQSRLSLHTVQPERAHSEHGMQVIALRAGASGDMAAVARFLFLAESADDLPLRIERLRLAQGQQGDQLTLELRLSTLCRSPASPVAVGPSRAVAEDQAQSLAALQVEASE